MAEEEIDAGTIVSHARARGLKTVRERVDYIADLMSNLDWERGKTAPVLAEIWGVVTATVESYSAEASRLVTASESEARRDISVGCQRLFRDAVRERRARDAKAVGELWATVSGAKAPEKHSVAIGAEPSPAEAARLVRERFGGHAMKDDDDAPGDAVPAGDGELPGDPPKP